MAHLPESYPMQIQAAQQSGDVQTLRTLALALRGHIRNPASAFDEKMLCLLLSAAKTLELFDMPFAQSLAFDVYLRSGGYEKLQMEALAMLNRNSQPIVRADERRLHPFRQLLRQPFGWLRFLAPDKS